MYITSSPFQYPLDPHTAGLVSVRCCCCSFATESMIRGHRFVTPRSDLVASFYVMMPGYHSMCRFFAIEIFTHLCIRHLDYYSTFPHVSQIGWRPF
jgi:hypothetical protein